MTSALERAVEVMDRLRSPGGCPWDASQTHESLARYLLEEAYEVIEAIETEDPELLREELGDLLLQVLFHARLAQELPPNRAFGIDEVALDLVDKLVRRHGHVFAADSSGRSAVTAGDLDEAWERGKIAEKGRTSVVDGVPINQPALALAAKLVSRARRAGVEVAPAPTGEGDVSSDGHADESDQIGLRLFAVVRDAVAAGVDPETALRKAARGYRAAIVAAENGGPPAASFAARDAEGPSQ